MDKRDGQPGRNDGLGENKKLTGGVKKNRQFKVTTPHTLEGMREVTEAPTLSSGG